MGAGDWIMATGEAKKHFAATGRRVAFIDYRGHHHWHEVFEHNPKIVRPGETGDFDGLRQGGGERPYIERKEPRRWVWRPYRPEAGEIFLTDEERAWANSAYIPSSVIIEPYGKEVGHNNKRWPIDRWAYLVRDLAKLGIRVVQIGPEGTKPLPGAHWIRTPTFRHAAALMSVARACIAQEGGLHHLAACFGTPTVVLWSEFISPEHTGYDFQKNIRHAGKPCGSRVKCQGCRRSLEAITVDEVVSALGEIVE